MEENTTVVFLLFDIRLYNLVFIQFWDVYQPHSNGLAGSCTEFWRSHLSATLVPASRLCCGYYLVSVLPERHFADLSHRYSVRLAFNTPAKLIEEFIESEFLWRDELHSLPKHVHYSIRKCMHAVTLYFWMFVHLSNCEFKIVRISTDEQYFDVI